MKANGSPVDAALSNYFAALGKKGGASKSPRKLAAVKANLAKANAKRAKAKVVSG
jgi:hypothetical protein